ncbi:hypothetical protein EON65_46460 [archaeon]|nr:MAG: hypothetical protein EON65_46460 [archaeon]
MGGRVDERVGKLSMGGEHSRHSIDRSPVTLRSLHTDLQGNSKHYLNLLYCSNQSYSANRQLGQKPWKA